MISLLSPSTHWYDTPGDVLSLVSYRLLHAQLTHTVHSRVRTFPKRNENRHDLLAISARFQSARRKPLNLKGRWIIATAGGFDGSPVRSGSVCHACIRRSSVKWYLLYSGYVDDNTEIIMAKTFDGRRAAYSCGTFHVYRRTKSSPRRVPLRDSVEFESSRVSRRIP